MSFALSAVSIAARKPLVLAAALLTWLHMPSALAADLLQVYRDAQANDAQFASARSQLLATREKLPQGRAGLLPQIAGTAGAQRTMADYSSPVDVTRYFNANTWALQLTQPLFRWDRWETYKQGELASLAGEVTFQQAQLDLITRASQAYFDVLSAQDNLYLAGAQKKAIGEQLEQAKRNFEVGTATITDANDAQARYDLATSTEIAAQSALEVTRATLQQITGKPVDELMGLRPEAQIPGPLPPDVNAWASQAEQTNPQVGLAGYNLETAQRETNKAKAGHLPSVDLVASYGYTNAQGTATQLSNVGSRYNSGVVGVQLNIPIFTGGQIQSRVRETLALADKAASDLEFARRTAAQQARQTYSGVFNGLAQVKALEAAERSAQSAVESNQLGYEVGVRINIDVLNAEAQLFSTRRDLSKARYDTIMNGMRLKASTGTLSEDDVVQINTLLTQLPGAMYRVPGKGRVGAVSGATQGRATGGRRENLTSGAAPRS
ncbi:MULTISPECIES: TolC family outer membrane protein [unclassified Cupriavidus]|uniref:TolC family outer membrane protein n=1 Tax=unclassified Cupriavidus TaxID=2640874 RepID=UPI001C0019E1|nr:MULTISPECIES: TolC family outer membrane protein [unclassified Cupriavidus]MCA3188162.1 TolC family outer membrane protein [Cupriavidus sp.]MCA3192822.1 TolC family outer membrane protein [Cupriavidus sp.]MCA3195023.1 TolC family outer membrane protein [Cupriavidus sp.]MCA3203993.1 TolC family outer membrane protein [Cupriavidus sp.]MCA3206192.1 TolC family outer membrane protein [Cupriavidus sp.]